MSANPAHAAAHERLARLIANVERVIYGKRRQVELAVIGLLAEGHVLIEDVPGTGKTVLAKAIARSLGCSFRRIQFTPDLLPSDVTGVSIFCTMSQLGSALACAMRSATKPGRSSSS